MTAWCVVYELARGGIDENRYYAVQRRWPSMRPSLQIPHQAPLPFGSLDRASTKTRPQISGSLGIDVVRSLLAAVVGSLLGERRERLGGRPCGGFAGIQPASDDLSQRPASATSTGGTRKRLTSADSPGKSPAQNHSSALTLTTSMPGAPVILGTDLPEHVDAQSFHA